jgi:AcrR family transcriptional regulator
MPRPADPSLPLRILAAAHALWSEGGEASVTIRDVAKRASTTTPSVYAHFDDRAAIVRGVRRLARARFEAALARSGGFADGCRRVLDFVDQYPRDYELLFGYGYRDRAEKGVQDAELSGFEMHIRAAGVPERQARPTALAIASLLHGTAMFRLAHESPGALWQERRKAALEACASLIAQRQPARREGERRRR